MKMSFVTVFTVQPAEGPNPNNRALEVMDENGFRLSYVNTEDEAANDIAEAIDPDNAWEGQVIREDLSE